MLWVLGVIDKINFKEGDSVKEGDLFFIFDVCFFVVLVDSLKV